MRVLSKAAIREFSQRHPDALEPLLHWHRVAKRAAWRSLIEVRRDFRHADLVGEYVVFNVAGNKYRLIASVRYRWRVIFIRCILTHAEYDQGRWKP